MDACRDGRPDGKRRTNEEEWELRGLLVDNSRPQCAGGKVWKRPCSGTKAVPDSRSLEGTFPCLERHGRYLFQQWSRRLWKSERKSSKLGNLLGYDVWLFERSPSATYVWYIGLCAKYIVSRCL